MHKLARKAPPAKRTKSSALARNGARKRTTPHRVAGKKLYAVRDAKGRFVDIQTYERAHRHDLKLKRAPRQVGPGFEHVIVVKATASEIRKALGIKRETTERVRQIIRDLEEKNWQVD
jgi:hypothetical protein